LKEEGARLLLTDLLFLAIGKKKRLHEPEAASIALSLY
jgi:hypothetical protein